jgi:hypothetical protein
MNIDQRASRRFCDFGRKQLIPLEIDPFLTQSYPFAPHQGRYCDATPARQLVFSSPLFSPLFASLQITFP